MSLELLPNDLIKLIATNYLCGYDSINFLNISKRFYKIRNKFGELEWIKFQYKIICQIIRNKQIIFLDKYGNYMQCQICKENVSYRQHLQHEQECSSEMGSDRCNVCYDFISDKCNHYEECIYFRECKVCGAPFPNYIIKGMESIGHYNKNKKCKAQEFLEKIVCQIKN